MNDLLKVFRFQRTGPHLLEPERCGPLPGRLHLLRVRGAHRVRPVDTLTLDIDIYKSIYLCI